MNALKHPHVTARLWGVLKGLAVPALWRGFRVVNGPRGDRHGVSTQGVGRSVVEWFYGIVAYSQFGGGKSFCYVLYILMRAGWAAPWLW